MYQAVNMNIVQGYKNTEAGHARNLATEDFADFVAHIISFQPVFHIATGIIGTTLAERGMHAQSLPGFIGLVSLSVQYSLNGTMYRQIRITADRRCKVCICTISQTKVTVAMRLINRLLHRTQHHYLQQLRIRTVFKLLGKRSIVFRRRIIAATQTQPQQTKLLA